MNYARHYDVLMNRARGRVVGGYSEMHHVVPRCLGGTNATVNLVRLTPEEHYVAHQLLVKMYPAHMGLLGAAMLMAGGSPYLCRQNKIYGWLRRRFAARMKARYISPSSVATAAAKNRGKVRSEAFKLAVGDFHRGRIRSPQTVQKMSAAQKLRMGSPIARSRLSIARQGMKFTDAHRENIRKSHTGHVHSAETRLKMSATHRRRITSDVRRKMSVAQQIRRQTPVSGEFRAKMRDVAVRREAIKRLNRMAALDKPRQANGDARG